MKVNGNNKKKRNGNERIIIRNDTLILYHHSPGNSPPKSFYLGFRGMVHWNKTKKGPAGYCQARPWKSKKRPF